MRNIKFFVDSCDPADTQKGNSLLGPIDGQTTNPTLLTKNPEIQKYIAQGKLLRTEELLSLYKQAIQEIAKYTDGAISVEVYADWDTPATDMLHQAEDMRGWARNIYMKFPTIPEGLKAAQMFTQDGGHANMTLVFDQEQAAAVYSATYGTTGTAFVSPFVGRWDDRGVYGLDVVRNIRTMYDSFDDANTRQSCHVEILAASVRTLEHMYGAMAFGADIITAPLSAYKLWIESGSKVPESLPERPDSLSPIPYHELVYNSDYNTYTIDRSEPGLLNQGLMKFAKDWNSVVAR